MNCKTCGGVMVQKSRARLLGVGCLMTGSAAAAFFISCFWVLGIILVLTAGYLIVWVTLGRGRWCRNCKKFSVY
jgi:hypothetical protein